jgi:hypothetical protein
MKLNLIIAGKPKDFVAPFISARALKTTIKLANLFDADNITEDSFDVIVEYIVNLYGKQFTMDELYDGISSEELISTFMECVNEITGQLTKKLNSISDPNAPGGKK